MNNHQHLSSSLHVSTKSRRKEILHLIIGSQSKKSTKEILQSSPLFPQSINRIRPRPSERRLEPITQNRHDRVKSGKLVTRTSTIRDAREEFRDNNKIDNQGGRKERILTDSMHGNGISTSHHEFGMILVHGDFGISYCRDVFDDDAVIDFTAVFVVKEDLVGGNDVVDDGRFADLFGTELAGRRQVFAIVVT